MNIHEYQAKRLFEDFGIKTTQGIAILQQHDIDAGIELFDAEQYVVKAQIHSGGRGKAGGVKLAKNKEDAIKLSHELWVKKLVTKQTGEQGQVVNRLYIQAACDIKHEYYLSMLIDRAKSRLCLLLSQAGGVDIEESANSGTGKIINIDFDNTLGLLPFHVRQAHFALGLPADLLQQMSDILMGVYKLFVEKDAQQIEINPLVLTKQGQLLALDGKVSFDDNALFKHPDITLLRDLTQEDPMEAHAANYNLSYIKMNGNIGCMVNGAGLAMATLDIIELYGAKAANFLDVGGGADQNKVAKAFELIAADPNVEGILVNIFGGIMRCDVIAQGIVHAAKDVAPNIPIVARLAGTNYQLGKEILENSGLNITSVVTLAQAAEKIVQIVKK